MQLKHVSFFAGIGGFDLGIEAAGAADLIKTDLFIENSPTAQQVLGYRFPKIAIHCDIKDYYPKAGEFNLYTIGFPCTGTSIAGNGTGLDHPESKLWFEALRCIADGRPSFVIIENPTGLITRGLRTVLGGLRMVGYQWDDPQIISAAEIGSPQERERLFIIAYTNNVCQRLNGMQTGWSDQIGAEIEAIYKQGGQVKPSSARLDDGVPRWLDGMAIIWILGKQYQCSSPLSRSTSPPQQTARM